MPNKIIGSLYPIRSAALDERAHVEEAISWLWLGDGTAKGAEYYLIDLGARISSVEGTLSGTNDTGFLTIDATKFTLKHSSGATSKFKFSDSSIATDRNVYVLPRTENIETTLVATNLPQTLQSKVLVTPYVTAGMNVTDGAVNMGALNGSYSSIRHINVTNFTANVQKELDTIQIAEARTVEYLVSALGTDGESVTSRFTVIHDGTNVYTTESAIVNTFVSGDSTNNIQNSLSATIAGGIITVYSTLNVDGSVSALRTAIRNGPGATSNPPQAGGDVVSGIVWRGAWDQATTYVDYDAVSYNGSSYIAIGVSLNEQPDTHPSAWSILASSGSPGSTEFVVDNDTGNTYGGYGNVSLSGTVTDSTSIGSMTTVDNSAHAAAFGGGRVANADHGLAVGDNSFAFEQWATAVGYSSEAAQSSFAGGDSAQAWGSDSVAIGHGAKALGDNAIAIGINANATYNNSIAIGNGAVADSWNNIALGTETETVVVKGVLEAASISALEVLPPGGATGQILVKTESTDFRTDWVDQGIHRVEDFGAIGNGLANDQAALQAALDALSPGETLILSGTYKHDNTLSVSVPGVTITGGGKLISTVPSAAAFMLLANRITISNLEFTCSNVGGRLSNDESTLLYMGAVSNCYFQNLYLHDGPSASFFAIGASYYVVENCRVSGGLADAFHNTGASHHGTFINCTVDGSGDDGLAFVGYESSGQVHDMRAVNCTINGTSARGIGIVGAARVHASDITIKDTVAAGIYIASEDSYVTTGVEDILIERTVVKNANYAAEPDHGSVMVYSGRATTTIENVTFRECEVWDDPGLHDPYRIVKNPGVGTDPINVRFERCILNNTTYTYAIGGNADPAYADITIGDGGNLAGESLLASFYGRTGDGTNISTSGLLSIANTTNYHYLRIVIVCGGFGNPESISLRFNNDSSALYNHRYITSGSYDGVTLTETAAVSQTSALITPTEETQERTIEILVNNDGWFHVANVIQSRGNRNAGVVADLFLAGAIQYYSQDEIDSIEVFSTGGEYFNKLTVMVYGRDVP